MAGLVAVGGALVDVRARTGAHWTADRSLPGVVRLAAGGAARNVAVNLVRFGHRVTLLSAVGRDLLGDWLLEVTARDGVDVTAALRRDGQTATYVTVGANDGPPWCVSDARMLETLGPADIAAWRSHLTTALAVIIDANFTEQTAAVLAGDTAGRPRVLLATSPAKAPRLRSVLAGTEVFVGNNHEATVLAGLPVDTGWQRVGEALLDKGIGRVVLTYGAEGVAVLTPREAVWAPAPRVPVVDPTGAGDAVAATAVHAYMRGLSAADTAALAAAAAAVVVQSEDNTPAGLAAVVG